MDQSALLEAVRKFAPALEPFVPNGNVSYEEQQPTLPRSKKKVETPTGTRLSTSVAAKLVDPKVLARIADPNSTEFDCVIDAGEVSLPPQLKNHANVGTIEKFVSIREMLIERIRRHAATVTLAQVDEAAEALGIKRLFDLKLFLDARRSVR